MRTPVLTAFRTGDPVIDKNLDHVVQTLNPVLRNPLLAAADFRWTEVTPASATSSPTFALQYRTAPTAWATIATFTSTGQIVQSAWIVPTLLNSWANYDASHMSAGYMKDSQGFVRLRGLIKSGTINTTAFTLPVGYRPAAIVQLTSLDGLNVAGLVQVDTVGAVTPQIGDNTAYRLDGLAFDTRS